MIQAMQPVERPSLQPFLTCAKCHDSQAGVQLGPEYAKVGKEGTAEYLIESVLSPSKVIKKGYETVVITTLDGRTLPACWQKEGAQLAFIDPAGHGKRVALASMTLNRERSVSSR